MSGKPVSLGKRGEDLAWDHLRKIGYRILARNYRVRFGEIDLIAEESGVLVFIEVKARQGSRYGSPYDALTLNKRRQISKVALDYISRNGLADRPARFDVVAVTFAGGADPKIEVLRNAFELCYGV